MNEMNDRRVRLRARMSARLSASAALALPLGLLAGPALAQAPAGQQAAPTPSPEEAPTIIVTGSRVARSGFVTATPTTVIDQSLINSNAGTGIAAVIQSLPALKSDYSSTNTGQRATRVPGGAFANLRSLGSPRTLTLVDGRRVVPTSLDGAVDLNVVPGILIDRVDVVTGGASAAYGSDAVAGVVNVVLKQKLEGVIGDISSGVSSHGDNQDVHIGLAGGTSLFGDRVHLTLGGEYDKNYGTGDVYSRKWGREEWGVMSNPAVTAANPKSATNPANLLVPAYHASNIDLGGVVTAGPLRGTTFLDGGGTGTFVYGSPVGPSLMSGGQNFGLQYPALLSTPLERWNALGHVDVALSDAISLWADGSYAQAHTVARGSLQRFTTPLTIRIDNPYLPDSVAARMRAAGLTTISVGKIAAEAGFTETNSRSRVTRLAGGLKGDLGGGWSWDAYVQYGRTDYRGEINNVINYPKFFQSIDAVRNGSGQIVCRSTLTNPGNGCVPTSIFGPTAINAQAKEYFIGDSWFDSKYIQKVAAANLRGEPFSTWAGPVALAVGIERREEKVTSTADPVTVACNQTAPTTNCFYLNNLKPLNGSNAVTEGYVEAVAPLLKDLSFAKLLELNAAVRQTSYRLSGDVTTWKIGLNYAVNDAIRFRATRSRDIRAPNLQDLFSLGVGPNGTTVNPATQVSTLASNIVTSNRDLRPEKADTTTLGIIVQPDFIPGLTASVDYYKIKMTDAISSALGQAVVNGCYAGITDLCQYVTLTNGNVVRSNADFLTGTIAAVERRTLNIAVLDTDGFDFELRYRTSLEGLLGAKAGDLTLQGFATYVRRIVVDDGTGVVLDRVGEVGEAGLGTYSVPDWRWRLMATYQNGPVTVSGTVRYTAGGVYNITYTAADINDNSVGSQTLFDLSGQVDLGFRDRKGAQIYWVVQNLFDTAPPVAPTQQYPTNPVWYDTIGRTFKLGVRFSL